MALCAVDTAKSGALVCATFCGTKRKNIENKNMQTMPLNTRICISLTGDTLPLKKYRHCNKIETPPNPIKKAAIYSPKSPKLGQVEQPVLTSNRGKNGLANGKTVCISDVKIPKHTVKAQMVHIALVADCTANIKDCNRVMAGTGAGEVLPLPDPLNTRYTIRQDMALDR